MIVMKFGGTSLESAAAIERAAGIVKMQLARRPVVVASAMGKTTDHVDGAFTSVEKDQAIVCVVGDNLRLAVFG